MSFHFNADKSHCYPWLRSGKQQTSWADRGRITSVSISVALCLAFIRHEATSTLVHVACFGPLDKDRTCECSIAAKAAIGEKMLHVSFAGHNYG
eukprot:3691591-Amphidinium_carterae.1